MNPFKPKSTAKLKPGHYWAIRLKDGRYACGMVLHLLRQDGKRLTRIFQAGLVGWCDSKPPTSTDVGGKPVVRSGAAHIKTITEHGAAILGSVPYDDGKPEEIDWTDDIQTWGYDVINILAEKYFGSQSSEQGAPADG